MSDGLGIWPHLTRRGQVSAVCYALRSYITRPPATEARCCMGSTVDPIIWCPRRASGDGLWCRHHMRDIARSERRRLAEGDH